MERKGLLVVSFGTTYPDTREKSIGALERALKEAYPEHIFYCAYTSGMVRKKLKEEEGVKVPSVSEALKQMLQDGITELLVQPTHIIPGIENDKMVEEIRNQKERFSSVIIGRPLLGNGEDYKPAIHAVLSDIDKELWKEQENTALVFMGHGSEHEANAAYAKLQKEFSTKYPNIYMGTVEGTPDFQDVQKALKEKPYKKIVLKPFMIVAGDHARNDMAGEEEGSWKSILESQGYEVTCILKGLGENPHIQRLFIAHSKEAAQ